MTCAPVEALLRRKADPAPVVNATAALLLAMFAAVAVVGVQTLTKVDFNDHRNAVIVGNKGVIETSYSNHAPVDGALNVRVKRGVPGTK